ncbi:hypothetical protein LCGC14_2498380 [marine sediment metagenome]|uniref:Uncharacterized protein n=1 Tax=marine sediment metagenome TaxID=412755 RepID=A0A0F9B3C3_9ZZZZ
MTLPPNTVEVKPENKCDVCREKDARYYNITHYIHICGIGCFEEFIVGYNREIEEISRKLLKPDETDVVRKKKDDL